VGVKTMSDKLDLKKHIRNVDDFPIPGIKFRDITSLIETPEPFRKTCKELTKITQDFSADLVVSIESRGFIVIIDDLVATGGTAIACAELLTENFGVEKSDILILCIINLPELGGSKLIADQGYNIETLVSY
jgi:adenine phosphoribosyltransferase